MRHLRIAVCINPTKFEFSRLNIAFWQTLLKTQRDDRGIVGDPELCPILTTMLQHNGVFGRVFRKFTDLTPSLLS